MQNNTYQKAALYFFIFAIGFSWPIMFFVDSYLIYVLVNQGNIAMALYSQLVGHGVAMFGPALSALIIHKCFLKESLPEWKWSRFRFYVFCSIFFILSWSIPAIIGILTNLLQLTLTIDSYYYFYMIIYIIIIPFAGIGEEMGWCSFLLSYLPKYIGKARTIVLSGIFRGLWHLPVVLGIHIYKLGIGKSSFINLIVMIIVLSLQLMISNVFIGSAFSFLWSKTKSTPLLGWAHAMTDISRDFISLYVIGYLQNPIIVMFAQLPALLIGSSYLAKLFKEEGIKNIGALIKVK